MEKSKQKELAMDIISSLTSDILSRIEKLPDNWDGFEIRQLILDTLKNSYHIKMAPKRAKEYRNTVLVNNL